MADREGGDLSLEVWPEKVTVGIMWARHWVRIHSGGDQGLEVEAGHGRQLGGHGWRSGRRRCGQSGALTAPAASLGLTV